MFPKNMRVYFRNMLRSHDLPWQGRPTRPARLAPRKTPKEGKIMMNKLAIAMIVASLSAIPMTSAYAQSASGSNNAQPATGQNGNSASGVKPTDSNGMPTNCKEGDTACSTDPNNAAGGTMGTTGTNGTQATDGMGNNSTVKDGAANSPKCKEGDTACDSSGGRSTTTQSK